MSDVKAFLNEEASKLHLKIIQALQFLGEKCLIECRTNKTYMDQTGNLTASMGYVITYNGVVVEQSGFEKIGGTDSGSSGKASGRALAMQIAAQNNKGFSLIVVAGMNYAYAVESRGLNVLSSAELLAEKEFPKLLKMLKLK